MSKSNESNRCEDKVHLDQDLAERLRTCVYPLVPKRDHLKWTNGISFKILSSLTPIPLHKHPDIFEPMSPSLTYDLTTLLASPPIRHLILTVRSTYGSPHPTTSDGPRFVATKEAIEWLREGLNVIKSSRLNGERMGWKGRGMTLGGRKWDELGVDDPYPPYLRPMEPLLSRQAIRETPFLLTSATVKGQDRAIQDRLKMREVPGDVKSVTRFIEVRESEEVLGGWKHKDRNPKKSESQLLNLTITLSLEQVASIRQCLAAIACTMPGKSNGSETVNEMMSKKRRTEEREWVGLIERTNEELKSKPREMSPPLFLQTEFRSDLNSTEEKHLIPLDLRDISETLRDALPIPTRPTRVLLPVDNSEGSSVDSRQFKRQNVDGIGIVEPLSPVFSDEGNPMSMKYIDELGTPSSPPTTSIRSDAPFIQKMKHPKYQCGFMEMDGKWKKTRENVDALEWEQLQMELPIFQEIQPAIDTINNHKVLLEPVLASRFNLPDELPICSGDDMTTPGSMMASDGRSSPLPDALEEFQRTVKEVNRTSGLDMYDVIMKEQLDQQEGGAMSLPYMASKDRARSAQIAASVPTTFQQIFRRQGQANSDQRQCGVIHVLSTTSATAELNWVPFSFASEKPVIEGILGCLHEDDEAVQALLNDLQASLCAAGTLEDTHYPACEFEQEDKPLVEKISWTTPLPASSEGSRREGAQSQTSQAESLKAEVRQLSLTSPSVHEEVATQPASWDQRPPTHGLDTLLDWQLNVDHSTVSLNQVQAVRGMSHYLALRGKTVEVEEDPGDEGEDPPEMTATASSQRSSNADVEPHPTATNSHALQTALTSPSHEDRMLHCLVQVDILRHRHLVRNLETSNCNLNPLDDLEADILISPRTAILVRNLAGLPAEKAELSKKLLWLASQFEQVVCVFEVVPFVHRPGHKRLKINPYTPPVICSLDKLRGTLKRGRAIASETTQLGNIDLAFATTGGTELGPILRVYSSWDRSWYEAQGLSGDELEEWMMDREFLRNEVEEFERALIANYGLNTFAALYVASLGGVDKLYDLCNEARLEWFGPRIGVAMTKRMNEIISARQQAFEEDSEGSMDDQQLYSEGNSFDTI